MSSFLFSCKSVVFLLVSFSVLFFPSAILLVNRLIKAEMTLYLDFVAPISSSSGLFLCSWLTCCYGLLVAQIRIRLVPDVGRNSVAMWAWEVHVHVQIVDMRSMCSSVNSSLNFLLYLCTLFWLT